MPKKKYTPPPGPWDDWPLLHPPLRPRALVGLFTIFAVLIAAVVWAHSLPKPTTLAETYPQAASQDCGEVSVKVSCCKKCPLKERLYE
jgi:hypothetical protein